MHDLERFRDQVTLITGASSGLGEEMAIQLRKAGARLALAARRTELLTQLCQRLSQDGAPEPLVIACDVTRDADVRRAVADTVHHWGHLDVAIANAGFGVVGNFASLKLEDYQRQFDTNVFGVLRTVYAVLPELIKTHGRLAVLGSVAGWTATPGTSPYAMSKFAVRALANAITPEFAVAGVSVTLVSPGFVKTDIRRVDNQGRLHAGAREPMPGWLVMDRSRAVRQMLRAIARRRREVIITKHGRALVALERFAPWIIRTMGHRMAARGGGYRGEPA